MSKSRWKRGFIIRERNWQSDAVPNYLIRSRVFRNFIRRRRKRCVSRDSITARSIIVSIEGKDGIGTLGRGIPWWISGTVLIFWVVRLVTIPERHHVPTFHAISSVISALARFDRICWNRNGILSCTAIFVILNSRLVQYTNFRSVCISMRVYFYWNSLYLFCFSLPKHTEKLNQNI